ncbi:MAG: hypothetical protein AB1330_13185 [Bacillota bacterium]
MEEQAKMPNLLVPVMTREQFAQFSGLGEEVVRGMAEKGHLPTVKIGRHRMINVARLTVEALLEAWEK